MKGLFSWGPEQLVPDEWALATQGGLGGPFQESEMGTEQAFGQHLPPALALETISEGGEQRGSKDGRKDSPPRLVTHSTPFSLGM